MPVDGIGVAGGPPAAPAEGQVYVFTLWVGSNPHGTMWKGPHLLPVRTCRFSINFSPLEATNKYRLVNWVDEFGAGFLLHCLLLRLGWVGCVAGLDCRVRRCHTIFPSLFFGGVPEGNLAKGSDN